MFAYAEDKCGEACHEENVAPEPKERDLCLLSWSEAAPGICSLLSQVATWTCLETDNRLQLNANISMQTFSQWQRWHVDI